jgi:hypothetical protein
VPEVDIMQIGTIVFPHHFGVKGQNMDHHMSIFRQTECFEALYPLKNPKLLGFGPLQDIICSNHHFVKNKTMTKC